jgi:hypothetical protein
MLGVINEAIETPPSGDILSGHIGGNSFSRTTYLPWFAATFQQ